MTRQIILVAIALVAIAVAGVGYSFFRPAAEATGPIEAIPIELEATPTAAPAAAVEPTATAIPESTVVEASPEPATVEPSPEPAAETATPAAVVEPTVEPTQEPSPAPAEPVIFEIVQAESEARYLIDEVLRGSPVTVVGRTNQVAGQIAVDPANPGGAQVGTILINARTFVTDESRRDTAVQNRILMTNQYEFISFTPGALEGLPEVANPGEPFSFRMTGDLTIRDQSGPATWEVTVTPESEARLAGTATTTIRYADWGLAVPDVPFVASVGDEVTLELDFVASAQQ